MKLDDVVKTIASVPEMANIGDKTYWRNTIPSMIQSIIGDMNSDFDFDFTLAEYSSEATVASQTDYEIRGVNNNLRDIQSLRIGDPKRVLRQIRPLDADLVIADINSRTTSSSSPVNSDTIMWYQHHTTNDGYPIITLVDTPTGVETLHIRYRLKDLTINNIPDIFLHVVVRGVMAMANPAHETMFRQLVKKMVKRYRVGGLDINTVTIDGHIALMNQKISNLNGVG